MSDWKKTASGCVRGALTLIVTVALLLTSVPTVHACKNSIGRQDPQVRFVERASDLLQKGKRKNACLRVLRKYALVSARGSSNYGYSTRWKGALAKKSRRSRPKKAVEKGFRKKMAPRNYNTDSGTVLYAYCIATEPWALKKADRIKPREIFLPGWYMGVLKQKSEGGNPVDVARYAEVMLLEGGTDQAKALLSELAAARTLPSAHAWLAWAKIVQSTNVAESRSALKRCKRMAKTKSMCRL